MQEGHLPLLLAVCLSGCWQATEVAGYAVDSGTTFEADAPDAGALAPEDAEDTGTGETGLDADAEPPRPDAGQPHLPFVGCFEAEEAELSAPMAVQDIAGEMMVGIDEVESAADFPPLGPHAGRATFYLEVPHSGTYAIFGRVFATDEAEDSFWVRVDDGEWLRWDQLVDPSGPAWHRFHSDFAGFPVPASFALRPGPHVIAVNGREPRAFLDKLLVTNNEDFAPSSECAH